jgi:hypothetical protein
LKNYSPLLSEGKIYIHNPKVNHDNLSVEKTNFCPQVAVTRLMFASAKFSFKTSCNLCQKVGMYVCTKQLHSAAENSLAVLSGSNSVTRLGEFSSIGRLFTMGSFLIAEVAQILGNVGYCFTR